MTFGKPMSISELKRWIHEARISGWARTGSVLITASGPVERGQMQRFRTGAPQVLETSSQTNEQLAALNTWEDEGGSTEEPEKVVGNRQVGQRPEAREQ